MASCCGPLGRLCFRVPVSLGTRSPALTWPCALRPWEAVSRGLSVRLSRTLALVPRLPSHVTMGLLPVGGEADLDSHSAGRCQQGTSTRVPEVPVNVTSVTPAYRWCSIHAP